MVSLRIVSAVPALFGVLVLIFVALRVLPGDPAAAFASSPSASQQDVAALRSQLHLDRPLIEQFALYLTDLGKGNLGTSLSTGRPVAADLADRLPASIELIALSFVLTLVGGMGLGILAALRQGSLVDHLIRLVCSIWITLPAFVTGLVLVYLFYYLADWAPAPTGRLDMFAVTPPTVTGLLLIDILLARDFDTFASAIGQLALPVLTLTFFALPPVARITRTSMLGVLSSDYIRTARSLGLSSFRVVIVYGLRNAVLPRFDHAWNESGFTSRRQRRRREGLCLARDLRLRNGRTSVWRLRAGPGIYCSGGCRVPLVQPPRGYSRRGC
ncbi:MAG: putative D,D-dipeptide transport system permease protein DdpB [Xylophilus sp.]|nr:MAG: putative D,D-dipeptide transport system permease protein DdpB [Xylophilus sp.]